MRADRASDGFYARSALKSGAPQDQDHLLHVNGGRRYYKVILLGAFLCLRLGFSVTQALRPFEGLPHGLITPFRDATWVESTWRTV